MTKRIEGKHTEFLQIITGNIVKQLGYGTWETPWAEGIREAVGTESARIYIERRQSTVAQWVALRPLFGYVQGRQDMKEGGGGGRFGGTKRRRKNNFGPPWKNHGKLKGGGGAVGRWACSITATGRERKSGWVIGMLGRRRVMPRWANNLV